MNTDKIYAEAIANDYSVKTTTKVMQLKKLDRKAKRPGQIFTWVFGAVSSLILGTGMCFSMGILSLGVNGVILGSCIGVVGIIGMLINYPIYKKIMKSNKQKYAADIIRLAKEISEEN